jgi:hypothetical protein
MGSFQKPKTKPGSAQTDRASNHSTTKEKMIHVMLPLARGNDPLTSFQAADSAKAFIRTHERRIINALLGSGPLGVDAIACYSDLDAHAVGKRMTALHKRGEVALTGRTVKSDSGRNQREWRAV